MISWGHFDLLWANDRLVYILKEQIDECNAICIGWTFSFFRTFHSQTYGTKIISDNVEKLLIVFNSFATREFHNIILINCDILAKSPQASKLTILDITNTTTIVVVNLGKSMTFIM
jgi:hypothetical protein